jgi:hypothetical protein
LVTVGLILGAAEIPLLYTAMAIKGLGGYAGVSLLLTAVQAIWLGMSCFGHIKPQIRRGYNFMTSDDKL